MDNIKIITRIVWSNREAIDFGGTPHWDESSFLREWIDSKSTNLWHNKPGWYWFESDISPAEFSEMDLPTQLPLKATKFNEVASFNLSRLHLEDIHTSDPLNVVYSGHENKVFSRLRVHFALTERNTKTGALGISSYPLSQRTWRASVFHEGMIDRLQDIEPAEETALRKLTSDKHSRELIESCWRIEYGWPILCIK